MGNCVAEDKTALYEAAFSNRLIPGEILSLPHLFILLQLLKHTNVHALLHI